MSNPEVVIECTEIKRMHLVMSQLYKQMKASEIPKVDAAQINKYCYRVHSKPFPAQANEELKILVT